MQRSFESSTSSRTRRAAISFIASIRRSGLCASFLLVFASGSSSAQSTDHSQQQWLLSRHQATSTESTDPALRAAVALGRKLYFDPRLSADGMISCATCHDVTRGLSDRRPVAVGLGGVRGRRNSPTTANVALLPRLFHDGRAQTLEEQAKLPLLDATEMGNASEAEALASIAHDSVYQRMFRSAYDREPTFDDVANALASFQRTLIYMDAPYDRWREGQEDAISPAAKRGYSLFVGSAHCASCHTLDSQPALATDGAFHNTGIAARRHDLEALRLRAEAMPAQELSGVASKTDLEALGRFLVTRDLRDVGAFRTASLRNVGVTAPYMHDGSLDTLRDVVDHYRAGGSPHGYLDPKLQPLDLTDGDANDLVEFLLTLTDVRFGAQQSLEIERRSFITRDARFRSPVTNSER